MEGSIVPHLTGKEERVFILDSFPVHTCVAVQQWFARKQGISVVLLPPKSGELNPVAKVCAAFVKKLNSECVDITNVDELWGKLSTEFVSFCSSESFENCIKEIPRLVEIIAQNGGNAVE